MAFKGDQKSSQKIEILYLKSDEIFFANNFSGI